MRSTIYGLVLLMFAASASADMSFNDYRNAKAKGGDFWEYTVTAYVGGLGRGINYANLELLVRKQPQLFCPPPKLILDGQNFLEMLDGYIRDHVVSDDTQIEFILLRSIEETFPCKNK